MTILIDILAFVFILGLAVNVHEFGHFIVAKLLRIRVEAYSVFGVGPRLFGIHWHHTDYRVSAIPVGAFVKLGGDESNAPIEGAGASNIPPEERFDLRPRWQRILVALAGPAMNFLLALSIPLIGGLIYGVPATPAPVVSVVLQGGAAATAGLIPGDRIVSFNGNENPNWDAIRGDALLSPGQPLPLVIERNGQRLSLTITPTPNTEDGDTAGFLDFVPDYGDLPVIVREVEPNTPAAEAGLQQRDRIIAVSGHPIRSAEQVTQYIREHKNEPITLSVIRNGEHKEITASVRKLADGRERLGFRPQEDIPLQKAGLVAATSYAVRSNVETVRLTGKALGQVFIGKRSARNTISGPIGIYRVAATSVERFGWGGLFLTLGFVSLSLGLINLLPIPILDGGAIFLLLIEAMLARIGMTLSERVRGWVQQVGLVMVVLLMAFAITNDLLKIFSRPSNINKPPTTAPAK